VAASTPSGGLEPDVFVLAGGGIRRPEERGDGEPAGPVAEQALERRPTTVVEW
jgi:hypothetical protein